MKPFSRGNDKWMDDVRMVTCSCGCWGGGVAGRWSPVDVNPFCAQLRPFSSWLVVCSGGVRKESTHALVGRTSRERVRALGKAEEESMRNALHQPLSYVGDVLFRF